MSAFQVIGGRKRALGKGDFEVLKTQSGVVFRAASIFSCGVNQGFAAKRVSRGEYLFSSKDKTFGIVLRPSAPAKDIEALDSVLSQHFDSKPSVKPSAEEMPSMICFDLDLTVWECGRAMWIDECKGPLRVKSKGCLKDSRGNTIRVARDFSVILDFIESHSATVAIAVASRTDDPPLAREALAMFGFAGRIHHSQIYPGSKLRHFEKLTAACKCRHADCLFFDDEPRNVREVGRTGVTCVHVSGGLVTMEMFEEGLRLWRKTRGKAAD